MAVSSTSPRPIASRKRAATRILVRFGDIVKDFHIHIIYASRDFVDKNPDAVRAFLAGWFETIAYMRAEQGKSVEIAAASWPFPRPSPARFMTN